MWIEKITNSVLNLFNKIRKPLRSIPPLLLVCELHQRPGLSAIALTTSVITRLGEVGIETGVNADGSPNKINGYTRILCEEIIKEIKENARVTIVIEPGTVASIGTGSSSTGPVVVETLNKKLTSSYGIIE